MLFQAFFLVASMVGAWQGYRFWWRLPLRWWLRGGIVAAALFFGVPALVLAWNPPPTTVWGFVTGVVSGAVLAFVGLALVLPLRAINRRLMVPRWLKSGAIALHEGTMVRVLDWEEQSVEGRGPFVRVEPIYGGETRWAWGNELRPMGDEE